MLSNPDTERARAALRDLNEIETTLIREASRERYQSSTVSIDRIRDFIFSTLVDGPRCAVRNCPEASSLREWSENTWIQLCDMHAVVLGATSR